MGISLYLAMTAAEIACTQALPGRLAYMACHFSPYSDGLSNLPASLPEDSMLILNDRIPIGGHSPKVIGEQLERSAEELGCRSILLDFQRPGIEETAALCAYLSERFCGRLVVSDLYAKPLSCPVFLPPPPLTVPLPKYLEHWKERQIWLEAALEAERLTLTEEGCTAVPLSPAIELAGGFRDERLHCSYQIDLTDNAAHFHLRRTPEDLRDLLREAKTLGIQTTIGLHQQLAQLNLEACKE